MSRYGGNYRNGQENRGVFDDNSSNRGYVNNNSGGRGAGGFDSNNRPRAGGYDNRNGGYDGNRDFSNKGGRGGYDSGRIGQVSGYENNRNEYIVRNHSGNDRFNTSFGTDNRRSTFASGNGGNFRLEEGNENFSQSRNDFNSSQELKLRSFPNFRGRVVKSNASRPLSVFEGEILSFYMIKYLDLNFFLK